MRRRLIAAVTLLAYAFVAVGFPLPTVSASAHACGQPVCCCGTEAQCRASGCACPHSPLPPPPETAPANCCEHGTCQPDEESSPCCTGEPEATTCHPSPSCRARPAPEAQKPGKAAAKPQGKTVRWVTAVAALKCQGQATLWVSTGAALPPQAPVCWHPTWPYCHSLPVRHERPVGATAPPLVPPPRCEA